MALTGKEMESFKRLQAKANEPCIALSDDDICKIEEGVAEIYNLMPNLMAEMMAPWNLFCNRLKTVANENAMLIAEIRRIKNLPPSV